MLLTVEQAYSRATTAVSPLQNSANDHEISVAAVIALVLWTGCLSVGLVGFVLPYARPVAPPKQELSVKAEMVQVELTSEPLPPIAPRPEMASLQPPAPAPIPAMVNIPSMAAVSEPSAVAFALPVEGPVTLVEPARASFVAAPPVKEP